MFGSKRPGSCDWSRHLAALLLLLTATCGPNAKAQAPAPPNVFGAASWIAANPASPPEPLPIFRKGFNVSDRVTKATLTITGLGHYEAHLNGRNVTDAVLTPSWSDYGRHVFYNTYDVTALLMPGPNALGILLGNGMYNVAAAPGRYTKFTGNTGSPKLIVALKIVKANGTIQTIVSDSSWRSVPGPIIFSHTYGGEDFDARLEPPGWDTASFDDHAWSPSSVVPGPAGVLTPDSIPQIKAFERYQPIIITHPKPGITVFDLGQNFAGWPEIEATGPRGTSIKLIPGELLDAAGRVTQRSADASPAKENSFTYILRGSTPGHDESWHPRFSYYGFRYVEAQTSDPSINLKITGHVLHDDVAANGTFASSSDLLNRTHTLINRAMLSNMVSVLTDCPHREKLGWLEQTHLAAFSLMYNYGLAALYAKMSSDMEDAQLFSGLVPDIAPEYTVFAGPFRDSPEWGAAVILSPWTAYQFYGDLQPLRDHYLSMQRYLAYLHSRAGNHILSYGLGDWYDIGPGEPGVSKLTSPGLTPTAIYFQSLTAMSRIATLLGKPNDSRDYQIEAQAVKTAFNAKFLHPDTALYDRGSQTANAMPLALGMVPESARAGVLAHLVDDIRAHQNHVTAGDIGFHYVVRALTDARRSGVLVDMLSRTDTPSYGDQLARGATTLTEAWDANPNSSQNHFMLGHAEEWFYRGLAGIDFDRSRDPDEQIHIAPAVVGDLTSASASFQSSLGLIRSAWSRTSASSETLLLELTIPANSSAHLTLPPEYSHRLTWNNHELAGNNSVRKLAPAQYLVHAGIFHFEAHR